MLRKSSSILAFFLLLVPGIPLAADALAVRYYEDAVSRFNRGDTQGAVVQLKNTLQRDPTQLPAKILLGQAYLKTGRPIEAEEVFVQAEQLGADPLLIALPLAKTRNELGKYDLNIEQITPVGFPRPLQADLWVELGVARLAKEDTAGARIAFEEATQLIPGHPGGLTGMARIPLKAGDFKGAEETARLALQSSPEHADAWFVIGASAHAQGQFGDAVDAYGQAYDLDPSHLEAAIGEAAATLEAGKPATAAALLKALRKEYPWLASIPYLQSEALKAMNRHDEAAEFRKAASDIIVAYASAEISAKPTQLLLYGTIAFESGELESAYQFLTKYIDGPSPDPRGRKLLGRVLMAMGKPTDAQKVLGRLSATNQADVEALALLGDAYVQLGDLASAARYYRKALQDSKGSPSLVRRLAMTEFRSGRRDQGLDTLETLAGQLDGSLKLDTQLLLGILYYSEGRFTEAGAVADGLVAQNPRFLTARNLQGLIAAANGDAAGARAIFIQILAENPDFHIARFNLIKLDVAQGRFEPAAAALNRILQEDPADTRALLESARLANIQGDLELAIVYLEKIRAADPVDVIAIVELINTYLATDKPALALERAIALDRDAPDVFVVKDALVRSLIANENIAGAEVALLDLARLAADDLRRLRYVARLQLSRGKPEQAAQLLTQALATNPAAAMIRTELATALFLQGETDEAVAQVERVLETDRRNLRALSLLADAHMAQGRAADAAELYRAALDIYPAGEVVVALHRALMTIGKTDEALSLIQDWNARHPDSPAVMDLLARHLEHLGQADAALPLRERLAELRPDSAYVWKGLANALSQVDSERAIKAALRAKELAPDDPAVLDTVGWTLVQIGNLDAGLASLRAALARDADNPSIRYHLAVALQEYGNLNGARQELERALRLSGSFPERADARARLTALDAARTKSIAQ